ncbi:hypothetical protein Bca4012_019582 [Brassica carinata]
MNQYSSCADPIESAARRARVRQSEENGEFKQVAASMARTNLEVQEPDHHEEEPHRTPEKLLALQRIGPVNEPISALRRLGPLNDSHEEQATPLSEPPQRRKISRTTTRRTTPASLTTLNAGIRKNRRATKTAPSPRPKAHKAPRIVPRNEEKTLRPSSSKPDYQSTWEQVIKVHSLPPVGLEAGTLAASIVWSLWISRNQFGFQNMDFTPEETITKAMVDAREWKLAQPPPSPPPSKPLIRSEPSPNSDGLLPIFTDAAWNPTTGHAGLDWILDDSASSIHQSATAAFVASPLLAETLAVHAALTSALSRGLNSVKIFSDSQILINTLNRRSMNLEIFGILQDIYLLCFSFKAIKFTFVRRTQNIQADSLAKQAL